MPRRSIAAAEEASYDDPATRRHSPVSRLRIAVLGHGILLPAFPAAGSGGAFAHAVPVLLSFIMAGPLAPVGIVLVLVVRRLAPAAEDRDVRGRHAGPRAGST